MEDIIVPISIFAAAFGIVYVIRTAIHKERMAMIERGANPEMFRTQIRWNKYNTFKYGMFLVGIAIGLLVAQFMVEFTHFNEVASYFASILLFGGIALIATYLLRNKLEKE